MSPSFMVVILFPAKDKFLRFTQLQLFEISEVIGMLNQWSPIMIIEPATMIERKLNDMIPVVKTDQLFDINSLVDQTKA
jgi:hypothetical protein